MHVRPYLNTFRGEPAISEFDWPFTPPHKSSPYFATYVGSALPTSVMVFQPAHGVITRFRVTYCQLCHILTRVCSAFACCLSTLTLCTRWLIMQKERLFRLIVTNGIQGLFHSLVKGSFHLSLTVLVRYRSNDVERLRGWSPYLPRMDASWYSLFLSLNCRTGLSPLMHSLPAISEQDQKKCFVMGTPINSAAWSGFARHYYRTLGWCLFL